MTLFSPQGRRQHRRWRGRTP